MKEGGLPQQPFGVGPTEVDMPLRSGSPTEPSQRCRTWGYYSGRQCSEAEGHTDRHITEPAVGRYSRASSPQPDIDVRHALERIVAWTNWKEQPRNGMRINMRLVNEEARAALRSLPKPDIDRKRLARAIQRTCIEQKWLWDVPEGTSWEAIATAILTRLPSEPPRDPGGRPRP